MRNFIVIATTQCADQHFNRIPSLAVYADGSVSFGDDYHFCKTCEKQNMTHLTSFEKIEVVAS